jgi:archaellum biogenesis ATPase FlaH
MYNLGEERGTRHIRIIRLASHYRKIGMPIAAATAALQSYAPSLEPIEVTKQVKSVYENGYNWGCTDPELIKFCTPNCIYYKNKDYAPLLSTASDLEKKYTEHIRTDYGDSAFNLADIYDLEDEHGQKMSCMVYPENFILFFGDSGLGKTAIAQNIAVKLPKMRILYISTEFGLNLLYRRFVQVAYSMTREEVDEHYRENDNTLSKKLNHITFFGKGMTTDELENMVKKYQPDLLIIDVVDGVKAPGREVGTVGNDTEVVQMIRHIVEEYKIIVLGVHHLSKHAAEDREGKVKKLTMHSGKGASAFEQKADIVLGVEGNPLESTRLISTLKGRDIEPFRTLQRFDKTVFQFTKLNV